MFTEEFMRLKAITAIIIGMLFCLQGCSTFRNAAKGAAVGAKEDWEALKKTNGWMKENLW
jgi:hypothetical protein